MIASTCSWNLSWSVAFRPPCRARVESICDTVCAGHYFESHFHLPVFLAPILSRSAAGRSTREVSPHCWKWRRSCAPRTCRLSFGSLYCLTSSYPTALSEPSWVQWGRLRSKTWTLPGRRESFQWCPSCPYLSDRRHDLFCGSTQSYLLLPRWSRKYDHSFYA